MPASDWGVCDVCDGIVCDSGVRDGVVREVRDTADRGGGERDAVVADSGDRGGGERCGGARGCGARGGVRGDDGAALPVWVATRVMGRRRRVREVGSMIYGDRVDS